MANVIGLESGNRPILTMGDFHAGHFCPLSIMPFHMTPYVPIIPSDLSLDDVIANMSGMTVAEGLETAAGLASILGDGQVFIGGRKVVVNGDKTLCSDMAARPSGTVYANGQLVFRTLDPTLGHIKGAKIAEGVTDIAVGSIMEMGYSGISAAIAAGKIILDCWHPTVGGPKINPTVFNNG